MSFIQSQWINDNFMFARDLAARVHKNFKSPILQHHFILMFSEIVNEYANDSKYSNIIAMKKSGKCRKILPYIAGLVLIGLGAYLVAVQPQYNIIRDMVQKQAELVKGRVLYENVWYDVNVCFNVYIFHVLNTGEVMHGATPQFEQRGPYVYNVHVKKDVLKIHEEDDEMDFTATRMYRFNKELSNGNEDDEVAILNFAYVGMISTMASGYPSFLKKLGNDIEKLFPDTDDLFVRSTVGNILFGGLRMHCDPIINPELKLICGSLSGRKPPGIKDAAVPGFYEFSFFDNVNGTAQGPFTVNRGVKNKTRLGDTTAFKGKRKFRFWSTPECNKVAGTDAITWPPLDTKLDWLTTFEPRACRFFIVEFKREEIINGLIGRRYELTEETWESDRIDCYCNVVKKKKFCLTKGVLDMTKCQESPLFFSEPNFLHGDPSLLEYAKGVDPIEETHVTFITIEPLSGAPLQGSKKLQLNSKLINVPSVTMLANVTEGYFPLIWAEEAAYSELDMVGPLLQAHRMIRLVRYLNCVPIVLGIFIMFKAVYLHDDRAKNIQTMGSLDSVLVRTHGTNELKGSIKRRSQTHVAQAFD